MGRQLPPGQFFYPRIYLPHLLLLMPQTLSLHYFFFLFWTSDSFSNNSNVFVSRRGNIFVYVWNFLRPLSGCRFWKEENAIMCEKGSQREGVRKGGGKEEEKRGRDWEQLEGGESNAMESRKRKLGKDRDKSHLLPRGDQDSIYYLLFPNIYY